MEQRHATRSVMRRLEGHVLTRLAAKRSVTFLALAEAFPAVPWRTLFRVLFLLRARGLVELRPLGWDYEVTICERPREGKVPSASPTVYGAGRSS